MGSLRQEPELLRSMRKAVTLMTMVAGRRRTLQKNWIWSRVSEVVMTVSSHLTFSHLHSRVAAPRLTELQLLCPAAPMHH